MLTRSPHRVPSRVARRGTPSNSRLPALLLLILALAAALLVLPASLPSHANTSPVSPSASTPAAAPAALAADAAVDLDPCQWGYYAGGKGPFVPLRSDGDVVPGNRLRVGKFFGAGSGSLARRGVLDFDGNGKSDIFRFSLRPDGFYQWQYAPDGSGDWVNLAYAGQALNQLHFGDFNDDGKTDIFTTIFDINTAKYRWVISYGGVEDYTTVNSITDYPAPPLVGDFNGDGKADIFAAKETSLGSSNYQWRYSAGATTAFVNLATSTVYPYSLRTGDFDGDAKTDIFAAIDQGDGTYQWVYSSGGAATYQQLARTDHPVNDLNFGDFDGDGKTDVFALTAQPDGTAEWAYWPGGLGPKVVLQTGPTTTPSLGDFDGDGKADAFLANCSASPRFTRLPRSSFDGPANDAQYRPKIGDLNGDGIQDLILPSVCQGTLQCVTYHNLVGTVLGDGRGGFASTTAQTLDTSRSWYGFEIYDGEVNGDGQTDLLFVDGSDSAHAEEASIYTAVWNGSEFTLSPRISLGPGLDNLNWWDGDFNGDGRTDFILNSVCLTGSGLEPEGFGCILGDDNQVRIALNNAGVFSLGALQALGTKGWRSYYGYIGDVNGDGNDDVIWNSTCQDDATSIFSDCDVGTANLVYVGLSNGLGGMTLSPLQTFGTSGWGDFQTFVGDFNGDGRTDLAWYQACPGSDHCELSEAQIRIGLANPDGTFQLGPLQSFGTNNWFGWLLRRADVDGDGKDDLIWYQKETVDQAFNQHIRVARANGNGTFTLLPTETLAGWHSSKPYLRADDLTADGKAELLWYGPGSVDMLLNGPVPAAPTDPPDKTATPTSTPTSTPTDSPNKTATPTPQRAYLPAVQS